MSRSLFNVFNESNPNKTADAGKLLGMGEAIKLIPAYFTGTVVANELQLPANAKAAAILSCFRLAGAATGYAAPVLPTDVLATDQCKISATGDIRFFGTDAVTSAEVVYVARDGEIYTETITAVASSATLPQGKRGTTLLSARVVTGLIPGAKGILQRGATATAGNAALSVDGLSIAFNAADVVAGTVEVSYIAAPGVGVAPASVAAKLLGPASGL